MMACNPTTRSMIKLIVIYLLILCEIPGYHFCEHGTFYDYGKDAEICCDTACEFDETTGNVNYRCKEECPDYAEILVRCEPEEAYINKVQREKNCIHCSEICSKYSESVCTSKCKGFKPDGCRSLEYYDGAQETCRQCTCKNEETCISDNCMDFYSLCHPNPCGDGSCSVDFNTKSYVCECPEGQTGQNCSQAAVDDAQCLSTCQNGNCTVVSGAVVCQCNKGWGGKTCSEVKKSCDSKPCQNDGICIQNEDDYQCFCSFPYSGKNCEVHLILVAVGIGAVFIIVIIIFPVIHCMNKRKQKRRGNRYKTNLQNASTQNIEEKATLMQGNGGLAGPGASTTTVNTLQSQQSLRSNRRDTFQGGQTYTVENEHSNRDSLSGSSTSNSSSEVRPLIHNNTNGTLGNRSQDVGAHSSTEPSIDHITGGCSKVSPKQPKIRKPKEESGDPNSEFTLTAKTSVI